MTRFSTWNFLNRNVQPGLTEGQFINSHSVLWAAGPPYLSISSGGSEDQINAGDLVYPVGLISNWAVQQNVAVVPIPEVGSYRRYTVTGPSDGQLTLDRILYHGPSLLRVAYAYYKADVERRLGGWPIYPLIGTDAANLARNPKNRISDPPGYENFWMNMSSDLLSQAFGFLLYIQDLNEESYGAVYFEQVHMANHSIQSGPGQLVVAEGGAFTFTRCRPVRLANQIPLMSREEDSGVITTAGTQSGGDKRIKAATQSNL